MVADNTVFRFEVLCTSKQLGGALEALHGRVMTVSPPQMAPQVSARNGVANISKADLIELFLAWLKKKKLAEFRASDVRAFLQEAGRSRNSYSYLLSSMKDRGQVRKIGTGTSNVKWVLRAAKPPKGKRTPAAAETAKAE
jgi:hypothetical protein